MALPVIWKQTTKCLNFSFEREMFSRRATSQANQADDTRRSIKVWVLLGGDDFPGKPAFNNGCNGMSCASTKYLLPKGNSNFPSECKVCESIIIRSGCNICKIELRGEVPAPDQISPPFHPWLENSLNKGFYRPLALLNVINADRAKSIWRV